MKGLLGLVVVHLAATATATAVSTWACDRRADTFDEASPPIAIRRT